MKGKIKRIYRIVMSVVVALCAAILFSFCIEDMAMYVVSPNLEYYSIYEENLVSMSGMELSEGVYVTTDNDPQMVFAGLEEEFCRIVIEFEDEISEDIKIAVYYGYFGKFYARICYGVQALEGDTIAVVGGVVRESMDIRIDIGAEEGLTYNISDIKIAVPTFQLSIVWTIIFFMIFLVVLYKNPILDKLVATKLGISILSVLILSVGIIWIRGSLFSVLYYGILIFSFITFLSLEIIYIRGAKDE